MSGVVQDVCDTHRVAGTGNVLVLTRCEISTTSSKQRGRLCYSCPTDISKTLQFIPCGASGYCCLYVQCLIHQSWPYAGPTTAPSIRAEMPHNR